MDKVKIQEVAEEAGMSNTALLSKAKELGFNAKVAASSITYEQAGILVEYAMSGKLPDGFKKPESGIQKVPKKKPASESNDSTEATKGSKDSPIEEKTSSVKEDEQAKADDKADTNEVASKDSVDQEAKSAPKALFIESCPLNTLCVSGAYAIFNQSLRDIKSLFPADVPFARS